MTRLDFEMVSRGLATSRERAKEYISKNYVTVNGNPASKAALDVSEDDQIEVNGDTLKYVGRGGLKLEHALKAFDIDLCGLTCLDIGASTGGFTDCMLSFGAAKVYAVDVGHAQLAQKLVDDPRVVNLEGVNVKDFTPDMLFEPIDFAASDLSFISVRYAACALKEILEPGKSTVLLIKPQFEAGRKYLGNSGVVKDKKAHVDVLESLTAYFESLGFGVGNILPSPIKGGDGNIEYLAHLVKQNDFTHKNFDFRGIVSRAFGGESR